MPHNSLFLVSRQRQPLCLIEVQPMHVPLKGGKTVKVKTHMISMTDHTVCLEIGEEVSTIHTGGDVGDYCLSLVFGTDPDTNPAQLLEQANPSKNSTAQSRDDNYAEELTIYHITPATLVRGSHYSKLVIGPKLSHQQ